MTSARKEHRDQRNDETRFRQQGAQQAQLEAMHREPRQPVAAGPLIQATRRRVASWMRSNANEYDTCTELAQAAAAIFLPESALNDECHWVWDEAVNACELWA